MPGLQNDMVTYCQTVQVAIQNFHPESIWKHSISTEMSHDEDWTRKCQKIGMLVDWWIWEEKICCNQKTVFVFFQERH